MIEPRRSSRLSVIVGAMASGKSAELIRLIDREERAGRRIARFVPEIVRDRREIRSRNGRSLEAIAVDDPAEIVRFVDERSPQVVAIDEAQFLADRLIAPIEELLDRHTGIEIVVALLDLDFAARPFPGVGELMALADEIRKLRAVCARCGGEASRSQRLVDGRPARLDDPLLAVESERIGYEARCRACYEPPIA